jgi:DUF4097 and DUF4098 domain-containing protein YvlB
MKYFIPVVLYILICGGTVLPFCESVSRFERTYTPRGAAHLTISNVNGTIRIVAWDKKTISARASAAPSVSIEDQVIGDDISISTSRNLRMAHADFEVSVPPETSISVKNYVGKIELRGISGHVSVFSIDSDVHLVDLSSTSVEVRVTSGDIYFDGDLREGGAYTLQTMKGDLDVTLPSGTPFNLNARALSENINLGAFISSLTGSSRGPKGVSGTHLRGGPRLTLTTYAGRILLHKK